MAIGVKLDFENTYTVDMISQDLRVVSFETILRDDSTRPLQVEISNSSHELLPNVFNLAFGPLNQRNKIDDKAALPHKDYSKVFSTILVTALNYLTSNPGHYLGIDGSDNNRAFLYWRYSQGNFDYLDQYFKLYGLKYYVRITRFGKFQYDNPFDFLDIRVDPDRLTKGAVRPLHMYNYFIFTLK